MLIKIINTYHNTETLCEFDSLEEAIKDQEGGLEFTAHNLVENDGLGTTTIQKRRLSRHLLT